MTPFKPILASLLILMLVACAGPTAVTGDTTGSAVATAIVNEADRCPDGRQRGAMPAPTPTPKAVRGALLVDSAQSLGTVSPFSYGTNTGPWMAVPLALESQLNDAALTYLRFPGGEWGDEHDLQPYQIDQFITLARQLNAEPSISVRLLNGTPAKAAELVRYTNIERGYGVRYWSIGNEPSLYATRQNVPAYDTEVTNIAWRDTAVAMRTIDPTIKLIGPDIHQFTGDPAVDPRDAAGRDWLRAFLQANGDLVDIVAIHRYPFPTSNTAPMPTIDDLRQNSREWETIIPKLRAIVQETTGCDLPIAVTEINSNWSNAGGGEATPDSFYNAIWWADVLGRLIRQRVDIVAHFALQSKPGAAGWGLLARNEVRPTYYVYQMYRHFGQELVHAASDDPDLTIYAARRDDGALTVMIINLGSVEKQQVLHLQNVKTGTAQRWLFDVRHQAERVPAQIMTGRDSVVLPAQSVMLYVLPQSP